MKAFMKTSVLALTLITMLLGGAPVQSKEYPPQYARGLTVPTGFVARPFGNADSLPTSLAWGADTGDAVLGSATARDDHHGTLLYVTTVEGAAVGNGPQFISAGKIVAFTDEGGPGTVVASGLDQPLGLAMGPDETLYVSETVPGAGRITALRDNDHDGVFETERTVLKSIPNGRHQTNGMAFGPDGKLYLANGNATDDGIECGPEPSSPNECPQQERKPWTGSIIRIDPAWNNVDLLADVRVDTDRFYAADGMDDETVLVSPGYRNIYDVDFNPRIPNQIWTPMNGPDNPSGSEPIYSLPIDNEEIVGFDPVTEEPIYGPVIEDAGFPSCLYDAHINFWPTPVVGGHDHPGVLDPENNSNQAVIDKFGPCPMETVMRPKAILSQGHEGTSGLAFERGGNFPARYDGDLFVAEWGSLWNTNSITTDAGPTITGHKVLHIEMNADGSPGKQREFMTGALPMDVTFGANGFLYMADMSGQIWEVQHVVSTPDQVNIDMVDPGQFLPQVAHVIKGQRVCWTNRDDVAHNVTAQVRAKVVTPPPSGSESPVQNDPAQITEMNSPGNVSANGTHCHVFDGMTGAYHYNSTGNGNAEAETMRGTIVVALER